MCEGFCAVDVVPSPKDHNQLVGGPVEVSVNCTNNGALPDVGIAVNDAAGAFTAVTCWIGEVVEPEPLVAFSVTEYVPATV